MCYLATIHLRFLDTEANDRVLLFLIDKGLQHTKRLGDCALKQLKEDSNMCDYQPLARTMYSMRTITTPYSLFPFFSPKAEP